MDNYYQEHLSAQRLELVYELAPPRVKRYLLAEISFVLERIKSTDVVLELGCGYGRVLEQVINKGDFSIGVDTSFDSLRASSTRLKGIANGALAGMNAIDLGLKDACFDHVICIQNGISAFHVEPVQLIKESIRVTKSGGSIIFSSYSDKFWDNRLAWFRIQAEHGLVGEIDWQATGDGRIVCKDGFRAITFGANDFESLVSCLGLRYEIQEVDESSIFCEIFA